MPGPASPSPPGPGLRVGSCHWQSASDSEVAGPRRRHGHAKLDRDAGSDDSESGGCHSDDGSTVTNGTGRPTARQPGHHWGLMTTRTWSRVSARVVRLGLDSCRGGLGRPGPAPPGLGEATVDHDDRPPAPARRRGRELRSDSLERPVPAPAPRRGNHGTLRRRLSLPACEARLGQAAYRSAVTSPLRRLPVPAAGHPGQ